MKRLVRFLPALLIALPLLGEDVDPKLDRAVRDALPVCADTTVTYERLPITLPRGFSGTLVKTQSPRPTCRGQAAAIVAPSGAVYVGMPWVIANDEGTTIEDKLRSFTWRNLQEVTAPTVDRNRNSDGLFKVTLVTTTEDGRVPMTGFVDPDGKLFFFGSFRTSLESIRKDRAKAFEPMLEGAPSRGKRGAKVTIVEFSDFQCPSCRRAAAYVDPILAAHAKDVRYVRFDVPLSGHSWSFGASMAGRAIYRQKPELFWQYKNHVYENQDSLSAFTIANVARAFAEDHGLDMERFDADVISDSIRQNLLEGAGLAFSNDVRGTPTYMVNGAVIDPGNDGSALRDYVEKLLAE